ncbi:PASTA domain-containing protein [Streptomyces spongiae]|uniref:PASTA domain-containing protein n=1 Tax=Streptomyces spongiae TaxID=565072 RepID=A0A5N8XB02_9ACTN|nr:PASTA domain-containing protein [Streptomyces spongiae]MPY56622.1 PASTA domain-containing protein [Streptomyces spongiae]
MTVRARLRRAGKSAVRRVAVLLAGVLIVSGCGSGPPEFAVKAVAAGIPSLAPFFEEDGQLGEDATIASQPPHSGLQQGNAPGLYGGSRKPTICDVERLKEFLTDPKNDQKAREWARVIGIKPVTADRIENYLDDLTPVFLRHDTLAVNHDYKKGKAVAFEALLEAGIAVLVDDKGMPAVKCSCGNPLRPFDKDPERIDVEFENGNKKWNGYDESDVVVVRPAPQTLDRVVLVDVQNPDRGIARPVGSDGEQDRPFDATKEHEVPSVSGMSFGAASQKLAALGLAVAYAGDELPSADARVTGSEPGPGTELRFGEAVALEVEPEEDGKSSGGSRPETPSSEGSPTESPTTDEPTTREPTTDEPTSREPTTDEPTTSEPTTDEPTTDEPTTLKPTRNEPTTSEPTSSEPTTAEPTTAEPTTRPTTSEPVTNEPVTNEPVTSEPASSAPASSAPASSAPVSSGDPPPEEATEEVPEEVPEEATESPA